MKISKLSYETEVIEIEEGAGTEKYLAFYYLVDGQRFSLDEHDPANAFDVVDEEASERNIVVLLHCCCGIWECSSLVASISETTDGLIQWVVDMYSYSVNPHTYYFQKDEYEKTMAEIRKTAEDEINRINAENAE